MSPDEIDRLQDQNMKITLLPETRTHEPLSNHQQLIEFQQKFQLNNNSFIKQYFLSILIDNIYQNINELDKQIDGEIVKLVVKESMVRIGTQIQKREKEVKVIQEWLNQRKQELEQEKKLVDTVLQKKSERPARAFIFYLYLQVILVQYGTYVSYSWDIMEPVACILSVQDVILAYSFWLFTQRNISLEDIHQNSVENQRNKYFRKNGSNLMDELDEIGELQEYLQKQRLVWGDNIYQLE